MISFIDANKNLYYFEILDYPKKTNQNSFRQAKNSQIYKIFHPQLVYHHMMPHFLYMTEQVVNFSFHRKKRSFIAANTSKPDIAQENEFVILYIKLNQIIFNSQ